MNNSILKIIEDETKKMMLEFGGKAQLCALDPSDPVCGDFDGREDHQNLLAIEQGALCYAVD